MTDDNDQKTLAAVSQHLGIGAAPQQEAAPETAPAAAPAAAPDVKPKPLTVPPSEPQQGVDAGEAQDSNSGPPPGHPRWDQVYGKMKNAERNAEVLQAANAKMIVELQGLRTEAATHNQETAQLVGNIDEQIVEYSEALDERYRSGEDQAEIIAKISELQMQKVMVGVEQRAQQHQANVELEHETTAWQHKLVQDFGITEKDMRPELLQHAAEILKADPHLQNHPGGVYYATLMAERATHQDQSGALAALRQQAKQRDQISAGAMQAVGGSGTKHVTAELSDILTQHKPGSPNSERALGAMLAKHGLWKQSGRPSE